MINASRGAVVDNDALLDLRRKDAGPLSVLDVWEGEPAIAADLLSAVELGTAHIAGYSLDGKYLATRMLRDAVLQYFAKEASGVEIASDSALPMQTPAGISGARLIRWALASHYDIRQDDRLLRQATIGAANGSAAAAFDQLRKN
jgi:erythronate-4-phosphate dehydrogenase